MLNLIEELRSNRISGNLNKKLKIRRTVAPPDLQEDQFIRDGRQQLNASINGEKNIEDVVSNETHTAVVVFLHIIIFLMCLFVTDLTIVFGIIGAFSEAFINTILSGLFLICTELKARE